MTQDGIKERQALLQTTLNEPQSYVEQVSQGRHTPLQEDIASVSLHT